MLISSHILMKLAIQTLIVFFMLTLKKIRCFFAFGGYLTSFESCRPLLFVDGTFLKGTYKGALPSAISKDGNDGMFQYVFLL